MKESPLDSDLEQRARKLVMDNLLLMQCMNVRMLVLFKGRNKDSGKCVVCED